MLKMLDGRWWADGVPLRSGDPLDLQLADGAWMCGRFELGPEGAPLIQARVSTAPRFSAEKYTSGFLLWDNQERRWVDFAERDPEGLFYYDLDDLEGNPSGPDVRASAFAPGDRWHHQEDAQRIADALNAVYGPKVYVTCELTEDLRRLAKLRCS